MRIPCPFCGERDAAEFVYRGDAKPVRPTTDEDFHDYVYLRENPAGMIHEHWYHAQGCRNWLVVMRDTTSHEIFCFSLARDAAS
jgi:heterotetrameric sarcosine oxidase delta subunit